MVKNSSNSAVREELFDWAMMNTVIIHHKYLHRFAVFLIIEKDFCTQHLSTWPPNDKSWTTTVHTKTPSWNLSLHRHSNVEVTYFSQKNLHLIHRYMLLTKLHKDQMVNVNQTFGFTKETLLQFFDRYQTFGFIRDVNETLGRETFGFLPKMRPSKYFPRPRPLI